MKIIANSIIFLLFFISIASANYFYEPMNFEPGTNTIHSFNVSYNGYINVTLPTNFTLINGSNYGNDSIYFTMLSPNTTGEKPQLFTGNIYLNGTFFDTYYILSTLDSNIVDTKIEIGHGDFNYIDSNGYIGNETTLLFSIVRLWAIGSDIINEPATNIKFNCTYPLIIPNSVDSKYTTKYFDSGINASGYLPQMEGISLFRIFVLSQTVDKNVGEQYYISCGNLTYDFHHTTISADIPDFNISVRSLEPLVINVQNGSGLVTYTIMNQEVYDIKNIEFLFKIGTNTIRLETDELKSGEFIQYDIETNESGNIELQAAFVPEWLFNSRSPIQYRQYKFSTYETTDIFYNLNASQWYTNATIDIPIFLETTIQQYSLVTLQNPLYGNTFQLTYSFYNDDNQLIDTQTTEVVGTGKKTVQFVSSDLLASMGETDFDVWLTVAMKDENDNWISFDSEFLGQITVLPLTDNGPKITGPYDLIIQNEYDRYEVNEAITAGFLIKNTGDEPDKDTILTYYLIDPDGNVYGETREQFLEIPPGISYFERTISLPLNAKPGEWKFKAEYETVVQPLISVYDSFTVVEELSWYERLIERLQNFIDTVSILSIIIFIIIILLMLLIVISIKKINSKRKGQLQ